MLPQRLTVFSIFPSMLFFVVLTKAMEGGEVIKTLICEDKDIYLTIKGTPEQVKFFELWSRKEGDINELEEALKSSEDRGFGINTPIKAFFTKEKTKLNEEFGDLSPAGYLILMEPICGIRDHYSIKKQDLIMRKGLISGIQALIGPQIWKNVKELVGQKRILEEEKKQDDHDNLGITAIWTLPIYLTHRVTGEMVITAEVRGLIEEIQLFKACSQREGNTIEFDKIVQEAQKKGYRLKAGRSVRIVRHDEGPSLPDCPESCMTPLDWFLFAATTDIGSIVPYNKDLYTSNALFLNLGNLFTSYQRHVLSRIAD